jgi:hypothetical protein
MSFGETWYLYARSTPFGVTDEGVYYFSIVFDYEKDFDVDEIEAVGFGDVMIPVE